MKSLTLACCCLSLSCCIGLLSVTACFADDFAIITAQQAYLLDDKGAVAATVPYFTVLDVEAEPTGRLRVVHDNQTLWLRRGLAHLGSQFSELNQNDMPVLRTIFNQLEKAARKADDQQYDKAITLVKEANRIAANDLTKSLPFAVWTRQYEAYLYYAQGEHDSASKILDELGDLDEFNTIDDHLLTADIYNLRGMLLEADERFLEATKQYEKAIAILIAQPHGPHFDLAVLYDNLADACEQSGETTRAVFASRIALALKRQILPNQAIEIALAHQRFGDLLGQSDDAAAALSQLQIALDLQLLHHATDLGAIVNTYSYLVSLRYENQDYQAAEEASQKLLLVAGQMDPENQRIHQRLAYNWLGSIELARENFQMSLKYYQSSAALADENQWAVADAVAWESIGDLQLKLAKEGESSSVKRAKEAYEKAIKIYAATAGADSEQVLGLREYSDDLESDRDDSLGCIVQVAMPQAYLLDEAGEVMAIVPGLEVLDWYSANEEFHEVQYLDKLGRIPNSQLLFRRSLPGYGIVKSGPFRLVMGKVSDAFRAIQAGEADKADREVQAAIERVAEDYGDDNSLHLWCRLLQASIRLQTHGPDAVTDQLQQLQEQLDSFPENAAPITIDAKSILGAVLATQGAARAALDRFIEAREIAEQRLGSDHAVTIQAARFAALQAQSASLVDADAVDVAIRELEFALAGARQTYPISANEITELTNEYANVLTQAQKYAQAAEVLEKRLDDEVAFPKESHALMVAQLGRAFLNLQRDEDGRRLLTKVIEVLEQQPEKDRMIPAALIAYGELGERGLVADNADYDQAAEYLLKAIRVLEALNPKPSMRLVELNRALASALQNLQIDDVAEVELRRTLAILESLDGDHKHLNEAIRLELKKLLAQRSQKLDRTALHPEWLAEYFALAPEGQSMYITQDECPVVADPADPSESIATLAPGKEVWSLKLADPMHQIYLPDEKRFGWVHSQHLRDFESVMIESGKEKLKQALQDQPPADLQACLAAFERGRPADAFADPHQGISVLEESLATIQSHYKNSNSLSALLYEELINLYQQIGNGDQILRTTDRSLTHFLFGHGFQHPITATMRLHRATGHAELGNHDAEASELEECLKTCVARFGPLDPRTQMLHLRLAANQIRLGSFELAAQNYNDVLATQSSRDDQPSLQRALAYLGLGELAAGGRAPDQATIHLKMSIDDLKLLKNPSPPLLAQALHILGLSYGEMGKPEQGLDRMIEAEGIKLGPDGNAITLSLMTGRSRLAARARVNEVAIDSADAAIQFASDYFGTASLKKQDPLHAKGIAIGQGDPKAAIEAFALARRTVADYVDQVLAFQSDQRKISFFSDDRIRLDQAIALGLDTDSENVSELVVEFLINGQRQLPVLLARDSQARAQTTTQDELTALVSWQRAARARANVPLRTLANKATSYFSEQIERLDAERKAAFEKLPENFKSLYRHDASPINSSWIECNRLRNRLATGEVLILVSRLRDPTWLRDDRVFHSIPEDDRPTLYVAWIVPAKDAGAIQSVSLGHDTQVDGVIHQFGSLVDFITDLKPDRVNLASVNKQEKSILAALGGSIWRPIEDKLPPTTTHLTLCLDGCLHNVPWAALPTKADQMVVDRYTIRHVSSARDLLIEPVSTKLALSQILLEPEYQAQDANLLEMSKSDQTFLSNKTRGTKLHFDKARLRKAIGAEPDLAGELLDLLRLRGDEFADDSEAPEGQLVIDAFRAALGNEAEVHPGPRASEFRYFAIPRPRALQITAPVFADPVLAVKQTAEFLSFEAQSLVPRDKTSFYNPLMQCGVLLAGFGLDEANHHLNDGVLTGEEIVAQDLRGTELVTLSIAPKALFVSPFNRQAESDAMAVLPHAFQLAGARAVLSSVWETNQPSTQRLLTAFYQQLASGKEKAAALRAAQLEIRDPSGAEAVPATFWANFRLTGEGWKSTGEREASSAK